MAFAIPGASPVSSFFDRLVPAARRSSNQARVAAPPASEPPDVKAAKVEIYSRRFCADSMRTKGLLDRKRIQYNEYLIDNDHINNTAMLQRSHGRTTTPQVFVDGRHIGGMDEVMQLEQAGELSFLMGVKE